MKPAHLFLLLMSCHVAAANAEITDIDLSTASDSSIGALQVSGGDVVAYEPDTDSLEILLSVSDAFSSGGSINALHAVSDTVLLLSVSDVSAVIGSNSLSFAKGDVVRYDTASDLATMEFTGAAHFTKANGQPDTNVDVDGVQLLANGNLLLSVQASTRLGGISIEKGDVIEYNEITRAASILFDSDDFDTSNEQVDSLHQRADGDLLLGVTQSATLAGLSMDDDDIVEYQFGPDNATLFFDLGTLFGTGSSEINAFSVLTDGRYVLVARNAASLGGQLASDDVGRYNLASQTTSRIFIGSQVFTSSENLDAFHVDDSSLFYLSTTTAAQIGATAFDPEDVVQYDPDTGTASVSFDGSAVLSFGRSVNAFYLRPDGTMLISVADGNDVLGGQAIDKGDIALYDPVANTATLLFDGSVAFGSNNVDLNGVHELADNSIALSTDSNATLAGLSFGDDDVIRYDFSTASVLLDGSSTFGNGNEDIDALHVLETVELATVDHFRIEHALQGVNCAAEPVTISARDADGNIVSDYLGTITLSTSTGNGDWSLHTGQGTLNPGLADSGAASYEFSALDGGQVVLNLSDVHVETVNINVVDGGNISETSNAALASDDPDLSFVESGLRFYEGAPGTSIAAQIAGKSSAVAPNGGGLGIQAIRTDTETGACTAALVDSNDVDMAFECVNPTACGAGIANADGGGGSVVIPQTLGGTAWQVVAMDFGDDSTSTAGFALNYNEAGSIRLYARVDLGNGEYASGSSNVFVVRPFAFAFSNLISVATANPAGTATAGDRFVAAGAGFDFQLGAYRWQSADDADQDGLADAGVDVSDNGLTRNFAADTALSADSFTPTGAGATTGVLGTVTLAAASFTAGVATLSGQTWSEVGSVVMRAGVSDYLGDAAADFHGLSEAVGRFFPDRFVLLSSTVGEGAACVDGFSYMAQPELLVSYRLEARNASNGVTANYDAARGYGFVGTLGVVAENADAGLDLGARLNVPAGIFNAGVADYSASSHQFSRLAAADGPYASLQLGLKLSGDPDDGVGDPDKVDIDTLDMNAASAGVCSPSCDAKALSGTLDLRFGRFSIAGAYGPETQALPVPAVASYFDGSRFVINGDDNCSSLSLSGIDLAGVDDDSTPDDSSDPAPAQLTVSVDSATSTLSAANTPLLAGDWGLSFSSPGAGNTGYIDVDLDLAALPWLRFDHDGDGAHDNDPPTARIVFGRYRGHDRIIYWREVLE